MTGIIHKPESNHSDTILNTAGITATLTLAEPTIFLCGFSKAEHAERPPALVRGTLTFHIAKPTKIKSISLIFRGISRTEWPEGIPSDKTETHESKEVFVHEWTLFSTKFPDAEKSSGAHAVNALHHGSKAADGEGLQPTASVPLVNQHDAISKGFRVFNPAEYIYNIEVLLRHGLPETLSCSFGNVRWGFELIVERYGAFKPNLTAHKDVTLLRSLGPSSLEACEPIFINRDWENLLHYEIVIAGKAFAIGHKFNVSFSFIPLEKVKLHRIRIYLTEHTEYYCRNKRIHRVEPSHKFLLCEKKSAEGNKGNLLDSKNSGVSEPTDIELDVDIPTSFPSRKDHLRPNASTRYIKVYHWVKLVMRVSHPELKKNGQPKCYEVSIDSPVTLVDGRTVFANELPNYLDSARRRSSGVSELRPYREYIQNNMIKARSIADGGGGPPNSPPQGVPRAIWFTRKPSIEPPPFDADNIPPQFFPPQYNSIPGVNSYQKRYEEYMHAKAIAGMQPVTVNGVPVIGVSTVGETSAVLSSGTGPMIPGSGSGDETPSITSETSTAASADDMFAESSNSQRQSTTVIGETGSTESSSIDQNPASRPVFSHIFWSEDSRRSTSGSDEDEVDPADPVPPQTPRNRDSVSSSSSGSSDPSAHDVVSPGTSAPGVVVAPINTNVANPVSAAVSPMTVTKGDAASNFDENVANQSKIKSPTATATASAPVNMPSPTTHAQTQTQTQTHAPDVRSLSSDRRYTSNSLGSIGSNELSRMVSNTSIDSNEEAIFIESDTLNPPTTPFSAGSHAAIARAGSTGSINSPLSNSPMTRPCSAPSHLRKIRKPLRFDSNVPIFSEKYMDRRGSSGSTSARYFRQSSIVSIDVGRQTARRPSHVSNVEEVPDDISLRRIESNGSFSVSVSEYQRLPDWGQGNAPLLGDGEIDMGLDWEHDYEDYELADDRRSIASSFYAMVPP